MHTASNITAPSNDRTDKEFSQTMAESLTLQDFEGMTYKEQAMLHQLFPNAYDRMIALQKQARNAKQGRTSYDDFVAKTAYLDRNGTK